VPAESGFQDIAFRGTFRPYQAAILSAAQEHLADGRISIAAAPGSGKTVLGLELIRWLGAPALVLSPTLVIAQQWSERLGDLFLPAGAALPDYVSDDLRRPALITSVTYQALHSAYRRLAPPDLAPAAAPSPAADGDGWSAQEDVPQADSPAAAALDFAGFDLIGTIRAHGITTICLDEAHHLRREWHRALEAVLDQLGVSVRIIALTATPPYDSETAEWDRYVRLCGPIDAEILVPELVADGTLCPHQDYIYFTSPTKQDTAAIQQHRRNVSAFLSELTAAGVIAQAVAACADVANSPGAVAGTAGGADGVPVGGGTDSAAEPDSEAETGSETGPGGAAGTSAAVECLFERADAILSLVALARWARIEAPKSLIKTLGGERHVPRFSLAQAQAAVEAMAEAEAIFGPITARVTESARRHQLLFRKRFQIESSAEVDAALTNSLSKLTATGQIAAAEWNNLGEKLRLVVLTDHIRADHLGNVGGPDGLEEPALGAIGAVPLFEVLRRHLPRQARIGLLTGSLTLWPREGLDGLEAVAREAGVEVTSSPLGRTDYVRVDFAGSNRAKVAVTTEAFRRGEVVALIGTAALLGEGWDSPCVNSLIMASYVSSFMLSNQMRGRAIRSYSEDPSKTANIWHVVALEPTDLHKLSFTTGAAKPAAGNGAGLPALPDDGDPRLRSADFRTLARRFRGFFGPAYSKPQIRTGIGRIDIIRPPLTRAAMEDLDLEMLRRAADRQGMAAAWRLGLGAVGEAAVRDVAAVTGRLRAATAVWADALSLLVAVVLAGAMAQGLRAATDAGGAPNGALLLGLLIGFLLAVAFGFKAIRRLGRGASTERTLTGLAGAVHATMVKVGEITSEATGVVVTDGGNGTIECSLSGGSGREKAGFAQALCELMSPIDAPRYLIVRRRHCRPGLNPRDSFACPAFVSTAARADVLQSQLQRRLDAFEVRYTRNQAGRALLLECRQLSYINFSERVVERFVKMASPEA
jgi:superfamily II DNA or RNA helicase